MTERQRLKRLQDLAEYGGMDVLYDYVMSLEREVEAYRRRDEKKQRRTAPGSLAGEEERR